MRAFSRVSTLYAYFYCLFSLMRCRESALLDAGLLDARASQLRYLQPPPRHTLESNDYRISSRRDARSASTRQPRATLSLSPPRYAYAAA